MAKAKHRAGPSHGGPAWRFHGTCLGAIRSVHSLLSGNLFLPQRDEQEKLGAAHAAIAVVTAPARPRRTADPIGPAKCPVKPAVAPTRAVVSAADLQRIVEPLINFTIAHPMASRAMTWATLRAAQRLRRLVTASNPIQARRPLRGPADG